MSIEIRSLDGDAIATTMSILEAATAVITRLTGMMMTTVFLAGWRSKRVNSKKEAG